jgi:hypothetical protein
VSQSHLRMEEYYLIIASDLAKHLTLDCIVIGRYHM